MALTKINRLDLAELSIFFNQGPTEELSIRISRLSIIFRIRLFLHVRNQKYHLMIILALLTLGYQLLTPGALSANKQIRTGEQH